MATPQQTPLSRLLMFPSAMEREFETEKYDERTAHFAKCGFLGLFLYDFFLLYHWELTPDVFGFACFLSLALFSPMLLFTIYVPTRSRSVAVREISWSVMPVIAVTFFMLISTASRSPYQPLSFYDVILVMIFTTAVQRLRLRYTLLANSSMMIVVAWFVSTSSAFNAQTRAGTFIFFAVAMVLMAMAAYAFDRESRLAYLAERQTRLLNAELQRVSRVDPLTGLWNRRHLETLVSSAWGGAQAGASMAVLLIDVDHFKRFNDTFGHAAGDACLVAVGRCLAESVESDAAAVRYGGEEFLVFVPDCNGSRAHALAQLICSEMRTCRVPIDASQSASVTVSIGVASAVASTTTADDLIKAADSALYSAKASGRDCVGSASELHRGRRAA